MSEAKREQSTDSYDVVVIGGAFAGASLSLLLRRWMPGVRVLVVERRQSFDRKIGEATVEMSGMFLHRVLKLYDYVSREHLPKHGLRFWFADAPETPLAQMSEVGPGMVSALPSFQLDRRRMDQKILDQAVAEGTELLRPARVQQVELGWPHSTVTIRDASEVERRVRCRWLIDASGRHNLLARKLDLLRRNEDHPTASVWGWWRGVKDLDGVELQGECPDQPKMPPVSASRRLATNHFVGYGWWAWVIPLSGGETSIGVVYDKRHVNWPSEGKPVDQYRAFVNRQAGLRELVDGAELDESDCRGFNHLSYYSTQYMSRGWAMVGDAAAFIDPYYSPGLDHASFSVYATARLLEQELKGELDERALDAAIALHNGRFRRSFDRWFDGLYRDKYEILGDAELTTASFMFDTAMYYLGVVGPATRDVEEFRNPVLGLEHRSARIAAAAMAFFRRRMVHLARFRRQVGTYGRRNRGWKLYTSRFQIGLPAVRILFAAIRMWLRAELGYWAYRLRHGRLELSSPVATSTGHSSARG